VNYFDGIDDGKTKALMAVCSDIVAKHKPKKICQPDLDRCIMAGYE